MISRCPSRAAAICRSRRARSRSSQLLTAGSPRLASDGMFRDAGADRADPADQDRAAAVTQVSNRDYKFCVGTRRSSHKGRFRGWGYLTAICRKRNAISINLLRLRAAGSRSPVRARHKGGPPGSLDAVWPSGPWDPARPAPAPRCGRTPHPAGATTVLD